MKEIHTKFVNFVKLNLKETPRILKTRIQPSSDNYVFHKGFYYIWNLANQKGEYVRSVSLPIQKSILMKILPMALSVKGFKTQPLKQGKSITDYFIYREKDIYLHQSDDVFKIRKGFEYRIRIDNNSLYLVIDYKIRILPVASYSQLLEKGISKETLLNTFVIFLEKGTQKKGKVEEINSEICRVKDLARRDHSVNLDSVYPEPKPHNLNIILKSLNRKEDAVTIQRKATFLDTKQASKRRLIEIRKILDSLKNIFPVEYEGFLIDCQFQLTPIFDIKWDEIKDSFDSKETLLGPEDDFFYGDSIDKEPQLLFDKEDPSKFHLQPSYGLKIHGPFSKRDISHISVSIITPAAKKSDMQRLIELINNGDGRYFSGMKRSFRINLALNKIIDLKDTSMRSYRNACNKYLQIISSNTDEVILVYIPEELKGWVYSQYFLTKHALLEEGYPSQMITDRTLSKPNYALLNLASAIYAKAGGVPWVLEKEISKTDMIIGLSYSQLIPEMALHRNDIHGLNRYIAFVNVFDRYGQWMFFHGNAYPYSGRDLPNALTEIIKNAVTRFEAEKGYKPQKIALHFSQKFSGKSKMAVIQALKENVNNPLVAFISIDDSHPFRAFDLSTDDGSFRRRSYVYLDKRQYLLSTTGVSDIAKHGIGTPKLLHISIQEYPHRFLEPNDVVEQVFAMTRLNWATVNTLIREPVTISFSRAIAYLVATMTGETWERIRRPAVLKRLEKRTWFI